MQISQIDKNIIENVNRGREDAFSELYKAYYVYLNSIAICYLYDKNIAAEVVDDVFVNIWYKRGNLVFPVHAYLVRSVQNGCLNYIRMQQSFSTVLDEHKDSMLSFQEEYIASTPVPLQYVEMRETEQEIRAAVNQLPPKCRSVFEAYFYSGKSSQDIAEEMDLTISTVRVQLKNATDKLKLALKHLLLSIFF